MREAMPSDLCNRVTVVNKDMPQRTPNNLVFAMTVAGRTERWSVGGNKEPRGACSFNYKVKSPSQSDGVGDSLLFPRFKQAALWPISSWIIYEKPFNRFRRALRKRSLKRQQDTSALEDSHARRTYF